MGKGTIQAANKDHAYAVVQRLMKKYKGKGHALYLHNYYTSIPLAKKNMLGSIMNVNLHQQNINFMFNTMYDLLAGNAADVYCDKNVFLLIDGYFS